MFSVPLEHNDRVVPTPRRARLLHGRDREVDAVLAAIRRRSARCVTLTGPIAIGKSRLLEEVRQRLAAEGIRARLVDGADEVVPPKDDSDVLVGAAQALVGLPREQEVVVGALPVPTGPDASDPIAVRRSPAVTLLADAAELELETLTADVVCALGRIAVASDGHPAVLEQLAGWLWMLSPHELASSLDDGSVDVLPPALSRRIRSAFDAFERDSRDVLLAVAETSAAFDLDAARAAVHPRLRQGLPQRLAMLVTSGWLLRAGSKEAPRWRIIQPFRPLLQGRSPGAARRRLTSHYADIARPLVGSPIADQRAVRTLIAAHDDLVAAWEDAHARHDAVEVELAVGLASTLWDGPADVAQHAKRILGTLRAHGRSPARARLELAAGDALWISGDVRAADAMFAQLIRTARRARDVTNEAVGWLRRAMLGPEVGRLAESQELLATGTELAARCDEPRVRAFAINCRGFLLRAAGDAAGALAAFDEEVELAREIGDLFYVSRADAHAVDCHLVLGQYSLGRHRYDRACRSMKSVYPGWARTLEGYIGLAAWEGGVPAEAASRCRRALGGPLAPRFGIVFTAARAGALAELGEHARAAMVLARAEAMLARNPSPAGQEAVHAAGLLVAYGAVSDEASRRALRARIDAYLERRRNAVAKDERPFVRAFERAISLETEPPASSIPEGALSGRPRLVKVLAVLREAKGEPVSTTALFRAVWADDAGVDEQKADARVRKAISLLRELGLRGAIRKTEEGYSLRT